MRDKTITVLLRLLLTVCIVFVCIAIYDKYLSIKQKNYDIRYKETINSSVEYPTDYVYRRLDRETGEVRIIYFSFDKMNDVTIKAQD